MLNKLREIFSSISRPINEDTGNELTDLDISRINLNVKKCIIDDLLIGQDEIKKSYDQNIDEFNELKKSEEIKPILSRIESKIEQTEQRYLEDKYNLTQRLRKAEGDLYAAIDQHCDLLKSLSSELIAVTGDFKYKKYLTDTLNRRRDTMPQIDSDKIDDIILHFQGKSPNAKVTKETINISDLKFAQNEINEDKVLSILETIDPDKLTRFLVSKDNTIIDGVHRVCALCEIDEEMEVACYKIHLDAKEAIRRLNIMKVTRNNDIYKSEEDESFELIKKAFDNDEISLDQYIEAKQQYDLIKARSGVYADNATNRRLKRVGQKYGEGKQDTQSGTKDTKTKPNTPDKEYSDKELQEHAKNASQQDLERQIKESNDPKIREHAHKEIDRRNKEEAVQEEEDQKDETPDSPDKKETIESLQEQLSELSESKGISEEERQSLHDYTGTNYRKINNTLRKGQSDAEVSKMEKEINSALDKLESHSGTVYRAESAWDDLEAIAEHYKGAETVKFDAFTSTSQDKGVVEGFGGDIFFEIKSKSGKDISEFSEIASEKEVLFKSKSQFKVKSVKLNKLKNGTVIGLTIKLEEAGDEVKKSEEFIPISGEQQISKSQLIDIFLNNINDDDIDNYLEKNTN